MQTISVVIATYNRAALLEATLERLCQQPFGLGDEVIVVDNASTDATSDVIARARTCNGVSLQSVRESTPGKTPALNAGLAIARGDILALTDDDVLVSDDWIPTVRCIFADPSVALVGGRVDPLWERPAPRWLRVDEGGRYGTMASPLALLHYGEAQPLGARTAVGANMIVRRSVHDAVGGFAPHLGRRRGTLLCGEDHEFCEKVAAAGYRCEYRPELKVQHWVPADRTTLRYYLRWFFWSGITNSMLERKRSSDRLDIPRHLWRRIVVSGANSSAHLALGRFPSASAHAMDAAYALGYVSRRIQDWRTQSAPAALAQPGVDG
jgi:glucosyl-dolichyl phosphate glucuronosyltransferase